MIGYILSIFPTTKALSVEKKNPNGSFSERSIWFAVETQKIQGTFLLGFFLFFLPKFNKLLERKCKLFKIFLNFPRRKYKTRNLSRKILKGGISNLKTLNSDLSSFVFKDKKKNLSFLLEKNHKLKKNKSISLKLFRYFLFKYTNFSFFWKKNHSDLK